MIYLSTDIKKKIKGWNKKNTYIVADFDKTLTKTNCKSSWRVVGESKLVDNGFQVEGAKLFATYRPEELRTDLTKKEKDQKMKEWAEKSLDLLIKYEVSEETIKELTANNETLSFKDGAIEFLEKTNKQKIPVLIISAGIRNLITGFLEFKKCYFNNIIVIGNEIEFKYGKTVGFKNQIIHSNNKNEIELFKKTKEAIKGRKNKILLGDIIGDINMLQKEDREGALKIGFLSEEQYFEEYMKAFDIVATGDTNYQEIQDLIKFLK